MGGLYPAASKFGLNVRLKLLPRKTLLMVYPGNAVFLKAGTCSVLNIVRKIKAGFNLQHTRCILCQIMCHFCVVLVSVKEYLSWLLRVVVSR